MDLKAETVIILFELSQTGHMFHPLTCSGGGGECVDSKLNLRKVKDEDKFEAYCSKCRKHTQVIYDSKNLDVVYNSDKFKYLYEKLVGLKRFNNLENILNNR